MMSEQEWQYSQRWEMQEVHPGIFIGPYSSAKDLDSLLQHGITHILCIRDQQETSFIKPFHPSKFSYEILELKNSQFENVIPVFEPVSNYIDSVLENNNRLLVHCVGGISRAPTLVIAYLMGKGQTFEEAYTQVQTRRFCINPCDGFLGQLRV